MACEETGMGCVEDKIIKNNYAAEHTHNKYRDVKTCGVIERDEAFGIAKSRGAAGHRLRDHADDESDFYGDL